MTKFSYDNGNPSSTENRAYIHIRRVEWNLAMIQRERRLGDIVYVRYKDHVLFKDVDLNLYHPWIRETVGWLDYEDEDHVRIVWERFAMPDPPNEAKPRATGLVILKKAIMGMYRVG